MDTSEKSFEAHIETVLTGSGYRKREPKNYNVESCMDEEMLFEFIYATQPKEWEKLKQQHGEEVLQKESLLQILAEFMLVAIERTTDEVGNEKEKETLIFPRYHQLDAVRKMVSHTKENDAGYNYLIQHSAGSGKTKTISWLAHKLAGLHTLYNVKIFDTVVVVSDRRVIDKQLRDALDTSKKIIVTTLQKFPYIVDEISKQTDKKFAVIIDEAHSSQTGESTKSLKKTLGSLEEAEVENAQEEEITSEEVILKELQSRGRQKNISFFAFTATHKGKDDTMILDFANHEEEIEKAFQPYYDKAILTKATDPNKLYDMERKLYGFHLYAKENVEQFAGVFFKRGATQEKLHPLLDPIVVEYLKREKKERIGFRDQIKNYIHLYAFLSLIIEEVNERFGTDFTDGDKVFFAELETRLAGNETLNQSAKTNTKDALKMVFGHIFEDQLHTMVESNFDIYKKIVENAEFGQFVKEKMFEEVYAKLK